MVYVSNLFVGSFKPFVTATGSSDSILYKSIGHRYPKQTLTSGQEKIRHYAKTIKAELHNIIPSRMNKNESNKAGNCFV